MRCCCCCSCSARWSPPRCRWCPRFSASCPGWPLVGLLAAAIDLPDHRADGRDAAGPRRRSRLRAVPHGAAPRAARPRHGRRRHRPAARPPPREPRSSSPAERSWSRSWASTSPGVPFVGAMGLASAIVVAVDHARRADPDAGVHGGRRRERARHQGSRCRDRAAAGSPGEAARGRGCRAGRGQRRGTRAERLRPVGPQGQRPAAGRGRSRRRWSWSCWRSRCSRLRLGQLDAGTNPTSESIRRAYDLIRTGFGPGTNGPLTVVVVAADGKLAQAEPDAADQMRSRPRARPRSRRGRHAHSEQHRRHGGDERRSGDVAAGRRDHDGWSTTCARRCCRRYRRRPTWSARPPATSTSPRRSPSGCRG